ncbi:hypothetical protein RhiLY_14326 [Ceratobasidium sp. AG-Ba]|nr:hypothetical protein RhiLY_14326 [Ceratobasidium sp. AG-Ba]
MDSAPAPHTVPTSLGPAQLRRLGDYLENKCLELTRGVRKRWVPIAHFWQRAFWTHLGEAAYVGDRNEPDAAYGTLSAYLTAASSLVNMILLIPPEESSASIRTSWLLRVTGDIFEDVPAYSLGSQPGPALETTPHEEGELQPPQPVLTEEGLATLDQVFQLFEKLDEGWCAVIRNERWDPALNHGIFAQASAPGDHASGGPGVYFSVTDRTRLRSIIVSGKDEFDDWLAEQGGASHYEVSERSIRVMDHTLREIGQDIPVSAPPESDPNLDPEDSDSDYM